MTMMIQSAKPRKQRLFRYTAPMHLRQHFLHVHVDKALRQRLQLKARTVQIKRGDSVKVMSGSHRGAEGKVLKVSLRTGRLELDTLKRKNARGKEMGIPISASIVYITELNLDDKRRAAKLNLKVSPQAKAQPTPKQERREQPKEQPKEERQPPSAPPAKMPAMAPPQISKV